MFINSVIMYHNWSNMLEISELEPGDFVWESQYGEDRTVLVLTKPISDENGW